MISGVLPVYGAGPTSADDDKRQMQQESAAEAAKLPAFPIHSPADVMHLSVKADMLAARLLLKSTPVMARLDLPDPGVVATLQTFPPIRGAIGTSHGFSMLMRDFSPPGSMSVWTTVTAADGRVQLSRDFESASVSGSTQLIEDAPPMPGQPPPNIDPVRLIISRNNEGTRQNELNLKLSAPTFASLCRDHPKETQEYLRPIFHDLGEEAAVFAPDPAAVWQALVDDWKADPATIQHVQDAIANFNAEDYQQRQLAAHDLHQIGQRAALILMHTDRSKFSSAQRSGVDTFLAHYLPLSPQDASRLGKDPAFLLDAQYCDDLILRQLAAARLAKITGKPVGFDPAADDKTRLDQIARVRQPSTTSP